MANKVSLSRLPAPEKTHRRVCLVRQVLRVHVTGVKTPFLRQPAPVGPRWGCRSSRYSQWVAQESMDWLACWPDGGRIVGMDKKKPQPLSPSKPAKVTCLKCAQKFQSIDRVLNRVCPRCRQQKAYRA